MCTRVGWNFTLKLIFLESVWFYEQPWETFIKNFWSKDVQFLFKLALTTRNFYIEKIVLILQNHKTVDNVWREHPIDMNLIPLSLYFCMPSNWVPSMAMLMMPMNFAKMAKMAILAIMYPAVHCALDSCQSNHSPPVLLTNSISPWPGTGETVSPHSCRITLGQKCICL